MKQIKLSDSANKMLTELSEKRKAVEHLNKTKQGIVAELIEKQYKKECK